MSGPIRDWHQIAVELLTTDLDLALLAIRSLFAEHDEEPVDRVVRRTREAYDSIVAKRKTIALTADEAPAVDDKISELRAWLNSMGESV